MSDNRGHGYSINDDYPLGYMADIHLLVKDQYEITKFEHTHEILSLSAILCRIILLLFSPFKVLITLPSKSPIFTNIKAGYKNIENIVYKDMLHEVLNEVDKEQVVAYFMCYVNVKSKNDCTNCKEYIIGCSFII